ncbi:MAG: PSD1 and planctomycete cytochrome C domain-containing protein [Planctomycetota bacterium]|nr:PSD1 and planctomycete cytochrome C domain-containing protein [Planctomycetota bacterium]
MTALFQVLKLGRSGALLVALLWCLCSPRLSRAEEPDAFFVEQVLPILEKRCLSCHSHAAGKAKGGLVLDSKSGWLIGGSSGPAIVATKPEESLLVSAIRYEGYDMPPDQKLPDEEIEILVRWIANGAADHRQAQRPSIDPAKLWALQPVELPAVPTPSNPAWCSDQADAFVLEKLDLAGLTPAEKSSRNVWLRRVTLDLTGLLPTATELEAFASDTSDRAEEAVVHRLLESQAFGDHWGRHWLDLACYADLADVQGDVLIRDAWRYRDYVIEAFNKDKPLDRFIREQIAGDLLDYAHEQEHREQIVATGFLAIGPWTLQNYIKGQLAGDVVDHQIDKIGKTFLGQTLACARCHDHKFDPVPTADYYALAGIFHSTKTTSYDGPGVWSQISHVMLPVTPADQAAFDRLSAELGQRKNQLTIELERLHKQDASERFTKRLEDDQANAITLENGLEANQEGKQYRISFSVGPSVWADANQATRASDGVLVQVLRSDGTVLAYHAAQPGAWSSQGNSQTFQPTSFEYQGDGTGPIKLHLTSMAYTGRFGGAIDDLSIASISDGKSIFQEDFSDCQRGSAQGLQAHTGKNVYAKCSIPRWTGNGINHSHAVDCGTEQQPNIAIQFYSGSPRATADPRAGQIERELLALDQRLQDARPDQQRAIALVDLPEPADCRIYKRGDFQSLGETVRRGFVGAVPVSTQYGITKEQSGRLQLAQWLTDASNPLTSRVMVNRIWKELFGQGLVRTVDYFGVHGEQPSHPELLDFLANRLQFDDAWSIKKTIERLVLSQTYRMSSNHDPKSASIDPDNRLLWHMPRRRMTAESIRDSILMLSGQLDQGRGGPSLGLHLEGNIAGLGGNVNPPTWVGKIDPQVRNRRTVYLPLKRERPSGELEILSVFDFPHPNDITGQRSNSTVATQALFLINAPMIKEQALKMAEHWIAKVPEDDAERYRQVILAAYSRPVDFGLAADDPTRSEIDELKSAMEFLKFCKDSTMASGDRSQEQATLAAWSELCHAILGSNEFMFYE